MNSSKAFQQLSLSNQRGAVIVLVALLVFVFLGIAAFAIDLGYRHVVRNELQNAADASALAAARELSKIYQEMSYAEQQTYVANRSDIAPIALQTALNNYAGDAKQLIVNDADVLIGTWSEWRTIAKSSRVNNYNQPDAVMVTTRREAGANGPISTFFAKIFGINTLGVNAFATAALSGPPAVPPGEIELPIGISRYWFENNDCRDIIAFSPSNDPASCAGWHTYTSSPANDAKMRNILENFIKTGNSGSPETIAGDTSFVFIGGELSKNTFESLMVAFQKNGYDISGVDSDGIGVPITDNAGNPVRDATGSGLEIPLCTSTTKGIDVTRCDAPDSTGSRAYYPDDPTTPTKENVARNLHRWPTTVPVYDRNDCSNPNQTIKIVGFAYVEISDVGGPSDKTVKGRVLCNYVDSNDTRGGGSDFGLKGSIPGLVE
ncbi:pilus assembly protein TadG-related protein [Desulfuromonas sp. CSMB_57]|jgi:Flp pilus assembly protein TadG|uniref:pilus assembly protein TadG-related protein n=1 Tax=Desulfuromonas sp. CSMB_57 TaxID=2807629 RepID=UPI001CD6530F|nr:pilus assembly protein TadG-related protein [Desulfuromonas sp. CSMB_57]